MYNVSLFIKQDVYKQRALSSSSSHVTFVHRKELKLCENQIFTGSNLENESIYSYTSVEQVCYCIVWLEHLASYICKMFSSFHLASNKYYSTYVYI